MSKTMSAKHFEQSTMKFSEAETLYNAGDLENRDMATLLEMKGVYNKVKTGVGDKERSIDKVLKAKAASSPEGVVKQLDFDSITMSGEVVDEIDYSLVVSSNKFLSEAEKLGEDKKYVTIKVDRELIFKDYKDGTMHHDLKDFVNAVKKKQFKLERVKKDDKS